MRLTGPTTVTTDKVGIGVDPPLHMLHVVSPADLSVGDDTVFKVSSGANYVGFAVNSSSSKQAKIELQQEATTRWQFGVSAYADGTPDFYLYSNHLSAYKLICGVDGSVSIGGPNAKATPVFRITSVGIVAIGDNAATPDASAQLDVASVTRGFLPPRMTTTQRDAIASPATGLVIFNITTDRLNLKQPGGWVALAIEAPKITVASSAPSSPATGDLWVDTT